MPCLTGFVVFPGIVGPVTIEFWDRAKGELLVSHAVQHHTSGLPYQYYFAEDYPVRLEDLDILLSEELDHDLDIIPRFGDRNPMSVWGR